MGRQKETYIFLPPKDHRRRRGCLITLLLFVLALAGTVAVLGMAATRQLALRTEKATILGMDKAYENFTVLHLSDLNASPLGENREKLVDLLKTKTFHAVCLTGDMVGPSGNAQPLVALVRTLQGLNPGAPIFLIAGDADPEPVQTTAHGDEEVLHPFVREAVAAGCVYLDAPYGVQAGKRTVWFSPEYLYTLDVEGMALSLRREMERLEATGAVYDAEGAAVYRAAQYRLDAMERTLAARKAMAEGDVQIALAHVPVTAAEVRDTLTWAGKTDKNQLMTLRNLGLLLAGHYAAGQWRLPAGGAVYVPGMGFFPPEEQISGMVRINSLNQYISPGLGAASIYPLMPGRVFNMPCATLISLTAKPY